MTDIHNSHKKDGRIYAAIDLKSFYASVECHERMLDPLETNLVVADLSRTEKTICLAVSPSLKAYGISVRARLFAIAVARTSRMCSFIRSSTSSIVITFCDLSNVPPPFRDML